IVALSLFTTTAGAVTYTPVTNYNGPDSFSFTVSDGSLPATATVSIAVTPVNDAPFANNQNVTTPEDTATNLVLIGSDVEGPVTFAILRGATNRGLSLLNTNTGAERYAGDTNYNGPARFTLKVRYGYLLGTVLV